MTVAKDATFEKPLPPTKKDAAFVDWYQDASLNNIYNFSTPVIADITLYAKWTTISLGGLQLLISDSKAIKSRKYTYDSYENMYTKMLAAEVIANKVGVTLNEITTAYNTLMMAISALVAIPNQEAVDINILYLSDGFFYIIPGQHNIMRAYAITADQKYDATDESVTFQYNDTQMKEWVDEILISGTEINFRAKTNITIGSTIEVTVKSNSNPAITKKVTLKAINSTELETMFINAVNALPLPANIQYEHYGAMEKAFAIYYRIPDNNKQKEAVISAKTSLYERQNIYYDLPERLKYSFSNNICTISWLEWNGVLEEIGKLTYVLNTQFPAGTYTMNSWQPGEDGGYEQYMLIMNSDGTGISRYRSATDINGSGATPWEGEAKFTYTNKGNQTEGGVFYVLFDYEKPIDPVMSNSARAKSIHRIF